MSGEPNRYFAMELYLMSPTNQTIFDVSSIANYRQVLGEAVNLKSTNKRFEVPNYAVASYEHALKKTEPF